MPNQSIEVSLPLNTIGPVMKMDPLNNLQVPDTRQIQGVLPQTNCGFDASGFVTFCSTFPPFLTLFAGGRQEQH